MTEITIHYNSKREPIGVRLYGHSGYAEAGNDIVCAALSVLMINTVNSIEQFTQDAMRCDSDASCAMIDFKLIGTCSEQIGRAHV